MLWYFTLVTMATKFPQQQGMRLMPIVQWSSVRNVDSIRHKQRSRYHGNLVTIQVSYVADAYHLTESRYQIWSQYHLRWRSYKIKCIWLRLIGSNSLTHWTHKGSELSHFPQLWNFSKLLWPSVHLSHFHLIWNSWHSSGK